jgi:CBS domain-containing protein
MSELLAKFTIGPNATLEEAAQKIEDNKYGTVIVVDGERAIGTVTDGDLRKAFLKHRLSVTPIHSVMNTSFLSVAPGDAAAAKSLFAARFYLRLIPEVDDAGVLRGVVRRDEAG